MDYNKRETHKVFLLNLSAEKEDGYSIYSTHNIYIKSNLVADQLLLGWVGEQPVELTSHTIMDAVGILFSRK